MTYATVCLVSKEDIDGMIATHLYPAIQFWLMRLKGILAFKKVGRMAMEYDQFCRGGAATPSSIAMHGVVGELAAQEGQLLLAQTTAHQLHGLGVSLADQPPGSSASEAGAGPVSNL